MSDDEMVYTTEIHLVADDRDMAVSGQPALSSCSSPQKV